ncbi:MAG TPA: arsenite methyltransferase [Terriglobales bacterium]|nr:arsenite methyltransferase [Terriglobales bacterium]
MEKLQVLEAVQEKYGAVARGEVSGCGCGSKDSVAAAIGYTAEDLRIAGDANLGLGCGNPLALSGIQPGMTVLDLGSGAGFDAFLAWRRVGPTGKVIGVDMTDDMLARARENAVNLGATNVEFRKGQIESLPVESNTVDLVISNCVINLSPDKPAVFREIARVLKPGGHFAVSDIVLLAELPETIKNDVSAYVGCISGALPMGEYVREAHEAGLSDVTIPEVIFGSKLASVLAGEASGCCGADPVATVAVSAVASIKLHGRKR